MQYALAQNQVLAAAPSRCRIISVDVNVSDYAHTVDQITRWSQHRVGKYVCVSPVHPIMEAYDDENYRNIINGADLVTADGMPVVWAQHMLGFKHATRVYGPELTLRLCQACEQEGISVGFYGGSETTIEQMIQKLNTRFPKLKVSYAYSPPFRGLQPEEDEEIVSSILDSDCQLLFVGLGTPKQDVWMSEHRDRLPLVQIGVGAAFDFIAGNKKQAPAWMQRNGLEWFFRLCSEPKRLWFRYLWHNPRFVALFSLQVLRHRFSH
ncbi:WecB/TagA/CpsF family glycosyltransferase [Pelagicoccus sp. SDUM812003]|uniref:WecB/TagA/CpsF family glycosyltransferase n=1 Tax=Pelagicoccus sp. SDUM812003 TaxID=3041267 RepID=UPI00280C7177|nr:WecB/TagA/CpsF family glycosyltransferase [Pelagicoccus sp. SDUM812003]MDQ8204664.1 WecB/TagA/CpsF family glycosyltransferase [Pelagicoccus sp. SDUM812003]